MAPAQQAPRPTSAFGLSLREQLIEVLAAETNYVEDEAVGAVFSEAAGADAILEAFAVAQKPVSPPEEVRLIEGESEEVGSSPIRFSYAQDGILEITYEPSWESIARNFLTGPQLSEAVSQEQEA